MPHLPSTPGHLSFVPDKALLYPKFQSYKAQSYSEETLLHRIPLVPPSRPVLPTNARVGFQEVRVRTSWNHLSQGWQGRSVLYVGKGGEIVRIQGGQAKVINSIPLGSRTDSYGYYARVIEVEPDFLVATNGMGGLFVLNTGYSFQEEPFILFDAKMVGDEIFVLVCHISDSGQYLVRKLRLTTSLETIVTLSGSEIPKHAVLDDDILLVTRSPFTSTSVEVMEMEVETTAPLYTYYQTSTDLDISIPLPLTTPKSAIQISFSTSTLQLRFLPLDEPDLSETFPFQTADEKPLWGAIDPMNSTWTLSSTTTSKVLEIHLEKISEGDSHWPQVFEDPDGAEEYTDPSDRRTILERLEKYTSQPSDSDAVRRRFLLEEDEDIDTVDAGDIVQFFRGQSLVESHGHDLLAVPFGSSTVGLKVSIDMCVFDVTAGHIMTVPAFSFVASSKRLRKYCGYTDRFAMIVESGRGGNMYVYYLPQDGLEAKQVVVRLGVESLGVGLIEEGVVVLGDLEAVVVTGL